MTCSFPSSTRAQLDNIIFYAGPPSKKSCELASTNADEWSDIDEILAQATREERATGIEDFDFATGFDGTGEGELSLRLLCTGTPSTRLATESQNTIDMDSAVQPATSDAVHSARINESSRTVLCQVQAAALGVATDVQDAPNVSNVRAQDGDTRVFGTIQASFLMQHS